MASLWAVRRSTHDTKVAGVCGGLAAHWNVDPVLVRVSFAVLALSGGVGLVLYAAGWLMIPAANRSTSILHDTLSEQARSWPREVWVAIAVIACVITFSALAQVSPFGFGPAVILAVIWYFGFYKKRPSTPVPPPPSAVAPPPEPFSYPGSVTPFTQAAQAWQERVNAVHRSATQTYGPASGLSTSPADEVGESVVQQGVVRPTWSPSQSPDSQAEDRSEPTGLASSLVDDGYLAHPDPVGLYQPSSPYQAGSTAHRPDRTGGARRGNTRAARRLRWVGLGALILVLCGLGAADVLGAQIGVVGYLAAALAVVGLTLIAATRYGRAAGLLPLGITLIVAVTGATAVAQTEPYWGTQPVSYAAVEALPVTTDRLETGTLSVDLTQLSVDRDTTYTAHVDLGIVRVSVPADTQVVVTYAIDSGTFVAYGEPIQGGTALRGTYPGPGETSLTSRAGEPTLTLNLSVGFGSVQVVRR